MAKKASLYASIAVVVLAGLFAAGYFVVRGRAEATCGICARHINPKSRVVAEVGGKRRVVCCAHCAITEGRQERQPVRLIEVTDYNTGAPLDPAHAWYVDGSRVVACEHDMTKMDEMKHAEPMAFDRCSPGTFAFRDRQSADAFVAQNGGVVRSLGELMEDVQP